MNRKQVQAAFDAAGAHFSDFQAHKDGSFTVRQDFYYRMGGSADALISKVREAIPNAIILDSGEVWKAFRGGASVRNQSHWFVKFKLPEA